MPDWKLLMGVDPEDLGDDDEKICDMISMVCVIFKRKKCICLLHQMCMGKIVPLNL